MSKLSRHGYVIRKKNHTDIEIESVKSDLNVSPFLLNGFGNGEKKYFKLYKESSKKLYLPRYYGLSKFGYPDRNLINDGDSINIKFNGALRTEQNEVFDVSYKQI